MKKNINLILFMGYLFFSSCNSKKPENKETPVVPASSQETSAQGAGQSAVTDDVSAKNIVQTAIASKDHSTLVSTVQAAGLVDVLSG